VVSRKPNLQCKEENAKGIGMHELKCRYNLCLLLQLSMLVH